MTKDKFDEEVSVCINTSNGDSLCSATTITKKIRLRVTKEIGGDISKGFEVELYDESNVDFLYCAQFNHQKFADLKHKQRFTFSIDQAPDKIQAFVKDMRQDRFVNCTLIDNVDKSKCYCRFELISRSEFKDMSMMSLELKKVYGEELNAHLIEFIDKYKRRCEEIPTMKKQFENLQMDYKKVREELKTTKEQSENTIQQLNDDNDKLMDELRTKAAEARHNGEEVETLEGNLRSLQAAYKAKMQEFNEVETDNERLVSELDESEAEIAALQSQLKENLQQKEEFRKRCKASESKLKSCKDGADLYKARLVTSENKRQVLEEEIRTYQNMQKPLNRELADEKLKNHNLEQENEQLSKEAEGLRTHVELLNTQLKEAHQKKSQLFKSRLFKQT